MIAKTLGNIIVEGETVDMNFWRGYTNWLKMVACGCEHLPGAGGHEDSSRWPELGGYQNQMNDLGCCSHAERF